MRKDPTDMYAQPRTIELLAPAKNLECGMAAIDFGADAVYIGASNFGARVAAGNTLDDIRQLCVYAHQFGAKVYVTVNTIIYEKEIEQARKLIKQIADAGADAVLIQDMGLVETVKNCPTLEMHASTQTDNRTVEKVAWLQNQGFDRVVLARELSLEQIKQIHQTLPNTELEVFVHGALCVSYSGACYASQHCFNRSANRGECAQFCRLSFDLVDSAGHTIEHNRHLLSLKDLCQIDELENIIEAGATSLKIEGRLKDITYVKNVVAAYSQQLDAIVNRNPRKYRRQSYGHTTYTFTPNLKKTFNRGFTHYFLHGRKLDIASFDTPKALGEFVGTVKEIRGNMFSVSGTVPFTNGDGLCFINEERKLEGFRVNRVNNNFIYPLNLPPSLRRGMALYRNNDQEFERILSRKVAERKIGVKFTLTYNNDELCLTAEDEGGRRSVCQLSIEHQKSRTPQEENIKRQLGRLGNTIFKIQGISIDKQLSDIFIPSSRLADMRRNVIEHLMSTPFLPNAKFKTLVPTLGTENPSAKELHLANVSNKSAKAFYNSVGIHDAIEAYETRPAQRAPLMTCRHCLRFALGHCIKHGGTRPTWHEPLFLLLPDGQRFSIRFDCRNCQMEIYAET